MTAFCKHRELNVLTSQRKAITGMSKGPELCLGMGRGRMWEGKGASSLLAMSSYIHTAMLHNALVAAARHIAALTGAAT